MIEGKRVVVVLPAYNAARTLEATVREIPGDIVDDVILVDDASADGTAEVATRLGLEVRVHPENRGYGGNQKTCYRWALEKGADIVVMLHPDYQYTPKLILPMVSLIASGLYDAVLGSRILSGGALNGGMPLYKYVANRFLTLVCNLCFRHKLSEYHTGYRAFRAEMLRRLPLERNSDDFVFDNEMLAQIIAGGYRIAEVTCPTKYFAEASSINFRRSVVYGLGVLWTACRYLLHRSGLRRFPLFDVRRDVYNDDDA